MQGPLYIYPDSKNKVWKKRKQRLWSIVVTERAKKEMIKEEAGNEKKR